MIVSRRRHRTPMRFREFPIVQQPIPDDDWSTILPTQAPTADRWHGEHLMILAMIADALKLATMEVVHGCTWKAACIHSDAQRQAKRWILSESSRPYGFLWCCQHLNSNPNALRRQLRMREQRLTELPLFAFATA